MFTDELNEYGYNVYYKVLNAKDYGVPQNRERVYLIFIKKSLDNGKFEFPQGFDNGIRLIDVLEQEVDEKYYISGERMKIIRENLGDIFKNNFIIGSSQKNAFVGDDNVCSSLTSAMGNGGGHTPMVKQKGIDKSYNNPSAIEYANCITSREDRGISNRQAERTAVIEKDLKMQALNPCKDGTCRGIKAQQANNTLANFRSAKFGATGVLENKDNIRIRKLTPKECFRLMGFEDKDWQAAVNAGISNSQLYKQAGNSIVVDVLYYIFVELYKAMPYLFDDLKLSSFFSGIGAFEKALDRLYESINTENFLVPSEE